MSPSINYVKWWLSAWHEGWNRFWFAPSLPHTLAAIRICCGAMLIYIHTIWASCVSDFMGPNAWIDSETIQNLHQDDWAWSWLWYIENPTLLLAHQLVAITVSLMMLLGVMSRITIPIAWFLMLMVCHRMTLALFGLDQIVAMLTTYLMIARSGSVWSADAWLRSRKELSNQSGTQANRTSESWLIPAANPASMNTVATRLIQLHVCVIYIFGGLSKMRGEMWFDGSAMWFTIANYEYQSFDLTFLGRSHFLISLLTGTTIFWETFYCALVWPRLTRPIALGLAFLVHGGIAFALGMVTFGFIMIVANFAFIDPCWVQRMSRRWSEE